MRERHLRAECFLPLPQETVFPFFADAANLEALTPEFLRFSIVSPQPIAMEVGTLIDYRIRVHGLPMRWRTRIAAWEPPHRFVDEQLRGPYRQWIHEHRFEAVPGSTRVLDHVRYVVPGGPLAPLLHALFVKRDLRRIFTWRAQRLGALLLGATHAPLAGSLALS